MDKLWYTYAIEYYSAIFKKLAFILQKDMARYCSLKKKTVNILQIVRFNCVTFWKRQNNSDHEKVSHCQGFQRKKGGLKGEAYKMCQSEKNIKLIL